MLQLVWDGKFRVFKGVRFCEFKMRIWGFIFFGSRITCSRFHGVGCYMGRAEIGMILLWYQELLWNSEVLNHRNHGNYKLLVSP